MNAPNTPHWTVNSCFGALHSVWVHLGSFRNCMKLGAKWGERSCHEVTSGFFATNAPNPPDWTPNYCFGAFRRISVHLGSFRKCMKVGAKHIELVQLIQKFVPWSHVTIFRNECTWSTPWILNSCFGEFHSVWMHLGSFHNCMKFGAKWVELVQLLQKFMPRSHVGIFCNEHNQSTQLDPIPMFRCVS